MKSFIRGVIKHCKRGPAWLRNLHPWRHSKLGWTRFWATCCDWTSWSKGTEHSTCRGPLQPVLFYDSDAHTSISHQAGTPSTSLAVWCNSFLHIFTFRQIPDRPTANFNSYVCQHNKLTIKSVTTAHGCSRQAAGSTARRLGFVVYWCVLVFGAGAFTSAKHLGEQRYDPQLKSPSITAIHIKWSNKKIIKDVCNSIENQREFCFSVKPLINLKAQLGWNFHL